MYVALRTVDNIFKLPSYWKTNDNNSLAESINKDKTYTNKDYIKTFYGTVGITKKLFYPVWIYGGLGFCYYSQLKEFQDNNDGSIEYVANRDKNFFVLNPEIGLQLKLGPIFLGYGINKPMNSIITKNFIQHFGVALSL